MAKATRSQKGNGKAAPPAPVISPESLYLSWWHGTEMQDLAQQHNMTSQEIDEQIKGYIEKEGNPLMSIRLGELTFSNANKKFLNEIGNLPDVNPSTTVAKKGLGIFTRMMRDDQVKAAMLFKKQAAIQSGWELQVPEDLINDGEDYPPADFVTQELRNTQGCFRKVLFEILSALSYGFSTSEIIYRQVPNGDFANMMGLRAIKTRHPKDIGFIMDEFGTMQWVTQRQLGGKIDKFNPHKFVHFVYQDAFSNPYGESDLEAAFNPWWSKFMVYRYLAMYIERFGVPPIFAMFNQNVIRGAFLDNLYQVITSLQSGTAGVIPRVDKEDVELWSPGGNVTGNVSQVFQPALEMYNRDISRALLMPGLIGFTPDESTGSFARSRVHFDAFMIVIEALRCELEDTIQEQLITPLIEFNFGKDTPAPLFKFLPFTDNAQLDLLSAWKDMVTAGVVANTDEDEKHIRQMVKFPERLEDEDEEEEEPEEEEISLEDGDDDEDDEEDLKEKTSPFVYVAVPDQAEGLQKKKQLTRAKTKFERSVDLVGIARDLRRIDNSTEERLVSDMVTVRDNFIAKVNRQFDRDEAFVRGLTVKDLRGMRQFGSDVELFLLTSFDEGAKRIAKELNIPKKFQSDPNFKPTDAIRHLKTKSKFFITGVVSERILGDARNVLLRAIETGELQAETERKLKEVFEPYTGDPRKIRDGAVTSPARLRTIIRTNTTDAFNQGRKVMGNQAGELLQAWQYSAILDTRTTAVCTHLDERIFRKGDPDLDRLTPPRHFNCFTDGKVKLYTAKGWKAIKDIKLGDLVLTHKGRFKPVIYLHHKQNPVSYKGKMIKISFVKPNRSGQGKIKPATLRVTPDHPLLTTEGWVYAKDLTQEDKLVTLSKDCVVCGEEFPWIYAPMGGDGSDYCSKSCASKAGHVQSDNSRYDKIVETRRANGSYFKSPETIAKLKAVWTPERRARQSELSRKQMKREYASGARDGNKITKNAHKKVNALYAQGKGPLNDPEIRRKAMIARNNSPKFRKAITTDRMGALNPISRNNPSEAAIHGRKKISETNKKRFKENPDTHPNAIMRKKFLEGNGGFVSKAQKELFNKAKQLYSDASLEHSVMCGDTIKFIDVALPKKKIGLEYDGSYWHKDKEKDIERDRLLSDEGWLIIHYVDRVPTKKELEKDVCRVQKNHDGQYKFTAVEIVDVEEYELGRSRRLYNIAVQDDESYVVYGVVSSNCRAILTPITITQEIQEKDFIKKAQVGRGLELSGKGFV